MKAAVPPAFCASAITCRVNVVLPEDSGPKISITRPRGSPPTPSAISSPSDPVEIAGISTEASAPPSFMMAPFPYCFSIWDRARSSARFLSSFSAMCTPLVDREIGGDYTQVRRKKPSPSLRLKAEGRRLKTEDRESDSKFRALQTFGLSTFSLQPNHQPIPTISLTGTQDRDTSTLCLQLLSPIQATINQPF